MLIRDSDETEVLGTSMLDPLFQDEEHDHRNASQHMMYTENIQPVSFNELTAPGNAEIQVADSPDWNTYAYIAGWSEMHIVDVTTLQTPQLLECTTIRTPRSSMSRTSSTTDASTS